MKKFLAIIFCSLYKSSPKYDDDPAFTVICIISILLSINAFTVYFFIRFLAGDKRILMYPYYGGILSLIILFILYMMFIKNKKHVDIYENFQMKEKKFNPAIITNIYVALTFIGFASVLWLTWLRSPFNR